MTQELLLFDASQRLVVCNQRYIEMYGLSEDIVKPGCSFREIIAHRKATGTFVGDEGEYIASVLRDIWREKVSVIETPDGRAVACLLTHVTVSPDDPAFDRPTKPIGPFYSAEQAELLERERGWALVSDANRGHRRVVPSPAKEGGSRPGFAARSVPTGAHAAMGVHATVIAIAWAAH